MKVEAGYRKEKIAEICADFGVAFSYKGSYPLKNNPGYWIWFPHFEQKFKGDFINRFAKNNTRIEIVPNNENGAAGIKETVANLKEADNRKLIVFPKLDDGFYTFSGVFEFSKEESTPEKEVYVKVADSYSDEAEPVAEKKNNKALFIVLAVVAVVLAFLGFKYCR